MKKSIIYVLKEGILFIGKIPPNDWHSIPVETIACNLTGTFSPQCKEGAMPTAKTLYWPSGVCRKTEYAEEDILVFFMFPGYLKIAKLIQEKMSKTLLENVGSTIEYENDFLNIFRQAYHERLSLLELKKKLVGFFELENTVDLFSTRPEIDSRIKQFSTFAQTPSLDGLDDFFKNLTISKKHFSRIFKNNSGASVSQYKTHHMLRTAVLLIHQGQNMTESSIGAGFYDVAHIYKTHLKSYGVAYSQTVLNSDILIDNDH